jgi:ankyrin repeat protein
MVEGMIAHGANADYANWEGNTALMLAIRCGNVRVVEILAARTKKINHSNHDGDTALSWAKEAGLKRLEPILIRHGARLLRRSKADPER